MKRSLDIIIAFVALILLCPLFFFVGFLVFVRIGRPIIFFQERPGRKGQIFQIYKFRTMSGERDKNGELLADVERLTTFGKWLRTTSLDELPELWNVLKGDMSLVGPRPLLVEYLPLYNERQARRHDLRPGITGWAQVNGRNATNWEDRLEMDAWYVENRSFWLDAKILCMTVATVLKREGVNATGHVTMPRFRG